jgi:hypothetical protein
MRDIINKIVNETFFGICSVIFAASALWIFPNGAFFKGCSICLALIFGIGFYIATIVRIGNKKMSRRYSKGFWLAFVIVVPVAGGLAYYYLRLAAGYLPALNRHRLWEEDFIFGVVGQPSPGANL